MEGDEEPLTTKDHLLLTRAEAFLRQQHAQLRILFKLGARGSALVWLDQERNDTPLKRIKVPACKFSDHEGLSLVDTTGAGDTFTAAYAVNMAQQRKREEAPVDEAAAMRYASVSAFLCITRFGALPSLPTWQEVSKLL